MEIERSIKIRPVLRWAGGKTWLINRISALMPSSYRCYHEPFVGGASIFLNLGYDGRCYLSDLNPELICFYQQVKGDFENLSRRIRKFSSSKESYYQIRNSRPRSPNGIAARFYYLNRFCFNGIYRVNLNGEFNVPYGYREIDVFDYEDFFHLRKCLNSRVSITSCDFEIALKKVKPGDFVFLDPPYTVAHNKNGFVEYNQNIFSWYDQIRLKKCIQKISDLGAFYLLTNADHESVKELYKGIGTHIQVDRYSTISAKESARLRISELIITNCI